MSSMNWEQKGNTEFLWVRFSLKEEGIAYCDSILKFVIITMVDLNFPDSSRHVVPVTVGSTSPWLSSNENLIYRGLLYIVRQLFSSK